MTAETPLRSVWLVRYRHSAIDNVETISVHGTFEGALAKAMIEVSDRVTMDREQWVRPHPLAPRWDRLDSDGGWIDVRARPLEP